MVGSPERHPTCTFSSVVGNIARLGSVIVEVQLDSLISSQARWTNQQHWSK